MRGFEAVSEALTTMPARPSYAKLEAMLANYSADNEALRARLAQLEHPPHFVPLKRANANGMSVETLRRWCHQGLVKHRFDGPRLLVDQTDLTERLRRLAG